MKKILIVFIIACLITGIWYFFFKPKPVKTNVYEQPKTVLSKKDQITKEHADNTIALMRERKGAFDNSVNEDWCVDENGTYSISYDRLRDNMIKVQYNKPVARYNFSAYRWDKLREEPKLKGEDYDIKKVLDKIKGHRQVEKYEGSFKEAPEYAKEFDNWISNYNYSYYDNLTARTVYKIDEEKYIAIMYTLSGKSKVAIKEDNYVICNDITNAWPIIEELQNEKDN